MQLDLQLFLDNSHYLKACSKQSNQKLLLKEHQTRLYSLINTMRMKIFNLWLTDVQCVINVSIGMRKFELICWFCSFSFFKRVCLWNCVCICYFRKLFYLSENMYYCIILINCKPYLNELSTILNTKQNKSRWLHISISSINGDISQLSKSNLTTNLHNFETDVQEQ